jgi:hypothetical protein
MMYSDNDKTFPGDDVHKVTAADDDAKEAQPIE